MTATRQRAAGWVVLAASVLALVLSAQASIRANSYAHCQSAVTEALIRAQTERADAAALDREADQQESAATAVLIRTVFAAKSRDETLAAYAAYAKTLDTINARRVETERARQAHPLPPPPSVSCG